MNKKVYVDGQSGTTGLKIYERLSQYKELDIIMIDYEKRRDTKERIKCMNEADVVFLCLPDVAAKEAVSLVTNSNTMIIDASTAHRTNKEWAYGLPELSKEHRKIIKYSKRISNPGCYATAFALSIFPLVSKGLMSPNYPICCQGITGYSGGGKELIEKYKFNDGLNIYANSPRPYSLCLNHKHLPEMTIRSGLKVSPIFVPVVSNYFNGLAVTIPIHNKLLSKQVSAKGLQEVFQEHFENEKFIKVMPYQHESGLHDGGLDIMACNDTNNAEIFVFGNNENETSLIVTRLDNLGKGASGAAIQNMNIILGFEEDKNLL